MQEPQRVEEVKRRSFLKEAATIVIGGAATLVPALAGLAVAFDPLRRSGKEAAFVRVTSLEALPDDGVPRKFTIFADRVDAWNKSPNVPVGAVYLRRTGPRMVEALNVVCPHLGCFVDYLPAQQTFLCPCHVSRFALDGKIADPKSPARRPMDSLEVEIRGEDEVWVRFQNFRPGPAEKIAVA